MNNSLQLKPTFYYATHHFMVALITVHLPMRGSFFHRKAELADNGV